MNSNLLSKSFGYFPKRWFSGCAPMTCSVGVHKHVRCFSNKSSDNDGSESDTPYIPRRIRKRLESRNLTVKDLEQRVTESKDPILTAKDVVGRKFKSLSSPDDFKKALNEARVGNFRPPEFPSEHNHSSSWEHQVNKAYKQRINPNETTILLFPGQGSQFVGMGKDLLQFSGVSDLYEKASTILGYDLLRMCLYGPSKDLEKTIHCQPAVLVTSLAAMEKLKQEQPQAVERCIATAGFSVGEFSALVVAGALQFEDAVKLIKHRAEYMDEAAQSMPGGMMSVFISHQSELQKALVAAKEYCSSQFGIPEPVCSVANFLCTDCKVLAGHIEALRFIEQYRKHFKLLRTKWLPVSGAFHTQMMKVGGAPIRFQHLLNTVDIQDPTITVHSNIDGKQYRNASDIKKKLPTLIYKPVAWEQTMHTVYKRPAHLEHPKTFGVGPGGRQLGTLLKLTNARAHQEYQSINV